MILSHFTERPFELYPQKRYPKLINGKPHGLWLSDEYDYGWKQWCQDNEFRLETLACQQDFECNLENWLVLKTCKEILQFTEQYRYRDEINLFRSEFFINWPEIQKQYGGILITPYQWAIRMDLMWYYGWDCASACVWDLTTIKPVSTRKTTQKSICQNTDIQS